MSLLKNTNQRVVDLERKFAYYNRNSNSQSNLLSALSMTEKNIEFCSDILSSSLSYSLIDAKAKQFSDVFLMLSISIDADTADTISLKLFVDGYLIAVQENNLAVGKNSIFMSKTVEFLSANAENVSLVISPNTSTTAVVKSISILVFGEDVSGGEQKTAHIFGDFVDFNNAVGDAVGLVCDKKIFAKTNVGSLSNLSKTDFEFVADGINADFAYIQNENDFALVLFTVSESGALVMYSSGTLVLSATNVLQLPEIVGNSPTFSINATLEQSGVGCVSATSLYGCSKIIVAYEKAGDILYRLVDLDSVGDSAVICADVSSQSQASESGDVISRVSVFKNVDLVAYVSVESAGVINLYCSALDTSYDNSGNIALTASLVLS